MLTIKTVPYDELPESIEKDGLSNNGNGKELADYLLVYHNDDLILCESDAVEPEDATLYRDFSWIPSIVRQAYNLGTEDMAFLVDKAIQKIKR